MPGAIQISAANNIAFSGGNYTQLGAGCFGIGNDPEAHITGVGLGASNISITDGYFTQVMGNSFTLGGIQANAHHPSEVQMINSHITISGNIFYNTSSLFSSTIPILSTYIQYSTIANNDVYFVPYSGISHGYGWGSNDAGGSPEYSNRGLYNFQPRYTTPTTSMNNNITGNLVHSYVLRHGDGAGFYTLSASPNTYIRNNYDYDSSLFGVYTDEGSNKLNIVENCFLPSGNWFNPNQSPTNDVGNNTLIDNFGGNGNPAVNFPDGTAAWGNTLIRNYQTGMYVTQTSVTGQRTAYRAGVLPGRRSGRPVSNNPNLADGHIAVIFPADIATGVITVNVSNFDDVAFTGVLFSAIISSPFTLTPVSEPTSVPANSFALATWKVSGGNCTAPLFSVKVVYTNPRLAKSNTLSSSITMPGTGSGLLGGWVTSSNFPAAFGHTCYTMGITTSGVDLWTPNDDWASIYTPSYITTSGHLSVYVNSQDNLNPWTRSGVVVRNSLESNTTSAGYAVIAVTPGNGVAFMWDSSGDGNLDSQSLISDVKAPLFLKMTISGSTATGAYSADEVTWTQVGTASLENRASKLDIGMIQSTHEGFTNGTAIFSRFNMSNVS